MPDSARLTAIYTLSAARILPFLALLVGPMRLGLDVEADVLLYLDRSGPAATGDEARARLARLLDHLAGAGATEVTVLAHSQGARIAVDALASRPRAGGRGEADAAKPPPRLVTVGAPLDTLYARFLHLASPPPAGAEWWNFYRPSDFVGGPIACGPRNAPGEQFLARHYRRSHFAYWGDAEVLAAAVGTRT
jgi:pimeloyl-ACP methyl ester carboxylesterase